MKKLYPHPILAREGWFFIALTLALSIAATWFFCWWSIPFWIICIFVVQFFRDPARVRPSDEGVVLSPADGRIVVVENAINEYTQEEALKISVFMNVFNVHSNRAPVAGTVLKVEYTPGRFFNADLDKASKENERNAVIVQSGAHTITFVQIAGLVARRILCYIRPNDTLEAGQRYGFIRFGSRVDVYLPKGSIPRVTIGDKVKATSTILADLPNIAERS